MGSEFGQFLEWKSEEQLEWSNLEDPMNAKMKYFTSQLNQFYKDHRCLWEVDLSYDGIEIIDDKFQENYAAGLLYNWYIKYTYTCAVT